MSAPEPICPICGTPMMEHRQRLKCPNQDCWYEETCCEGGPSPVERVTSEPSHMTKKEGESASEK